MNYDLQALDASLAKRIQEKKLPGVTDVYVYKNENPAQ